MRFSEAATLKNWIACRGESNADTTAMRSWAEHGCGKSTPKPASTNGKSCRDKFSEKMNHVFPLTPGFRPATTATQMKNCFNSFHLGEKPFKLLSFYCALNTQLKPGVNQRAARIWQYR